MKPNKITIIISVYKNVKALDIILEALNSQTIQPDEIIISEDCESNEMKNYLSNLNNNKIVHLTQEDLGWRKNKALNRAISSATGDYLIFIDGDVVPDKRFIEGHINCSNPKIICAGKRASLGKKYSQLVYHRKITIETIANNYIMNIIKLHKDDIKHYEDGIYSPLLNKVTASRYIRHIIGCNFSCYKADILSINGFNEDFIHPAVGEDVDITWRFRGVGMEIKSCRYIANQYHLWHKKNFGSNEGTINHKIMDVNIEKKQYICLNGLKKLNEGESL